MELSSRGNSRGFENRYENDDDDYDEIEEDDEEKEIAIVSRTLIEDLRTAILAARFSFLILFTLGSLFLYQTVIVPYKLPGGPQDLTLNDYDSLVRNKSTINYFHTNYLFP